MLPDPLPPSFASTREALRAVACYAIAPARKSRSGRIGLRSVEERIATPAFDDGTRIWIDGAMLRWGARSAPITTTREAASFLGVEVSADPGVGRDLPPFRPDDPLAVHHGASRALGRWYAFGQAVIDALSGTAVSEAQIWPEHFDLATVVDGRVNVGFSPGDGYSAEPYVYVGPHGFSGPDGGFWNAPFGAALTYAQLRPTADPTRSALEFVAEGLRRA